MNSNGGPFSDPEFDHKFTVWMHSIEIEMRTLRFYSRIVSNLPWPIVWSITSPFSVTCSFLLAIQLLRKKFEIEAPRAHSDPSRQSIVLGRIEHDLVGLFPSPSITTPDTVPSQVGDAIVIFKGGSRPYVIRKQGEHWRIIGAAYVHGIMYGSAFDESKCIGIQPV